MDTNYKLEKKIRRIVHDVNKDIFTFDFRKTSGEVMQGTTDEEKRIFEALPFYRQKDPRRLALNEASVDFESTKTLFSFLDNTPDGLLRIIYREVEKDAEDLKKITPEEQTYQQSYYLALYYIVPEILWVHGDDSAKSNLFT